MSNKTGYELRYDILQLAVSILSENARLQRDHEETVIRHQMDGASVNGKRFSPNDEGAPNYKLTPQGITTEAVLAEAAKLYQFVESDSRR
jgi:hypothetical protein